MNFIKRAMKSLQREKKRTMILFSILFLVGNLIGIAVSIHESSLNVGEETVSSLGSKAIISIDEEAVAAYYQTEGVYPELEQLTSDTYEDISKLDEVAYFSENKKIEIGAYNLEWTGDYSSLESTFDAFFSGEYIAQGGTVSSGITGDGGDDGSNREDVKIPENLFELMGATNPILPAEKDGSIEITDGRGLTQDEIDEGQAKVVISKEVAQLNDLSVGDVFDITYLVAYSIPEEETRQLEIVGLYEEIRKPDTTEENFIDATSYLESVKGKHQIYMPMKMFDAFIGQTDEQNSHAATMESNTIYLNSYSDLDSFTEKVSKITNNPFYTVISSDAVYDQVSGAINEIEETGRFLTIGSVIVSILIISLLVTLFLKERRHEFGIYASLGEKRIKTSGQILIEMLVVSFVALSLSVVSATAISNQLSSTLIDVALESTAKNENEIEGLGDIQFNNNSYTDMLIEQNFGDIELSEEDVVNAYKVTFSTEYVIYFIAIGIMTVLLSAILPMLYLLRLKPKKILL